jgi:5'-nucleotidase (lipoprotein e(P4) family)
MKNLFLQLAALAVLSIFSTGCQTKPDNPSHNEHLVMATLYHQASAEYVALCHQAFNIAKRNILESLSVDHGEKLAIITDIDETVLDNSPYQAKCIIENIKYPEQWDEWCLRAEAATIPGSLRFFNMVAERGIEVFYITNRKAHLMQPTIKNLRKRGFPYADESHLLMRVEDNSKEERRSLIEGDYKIILLLGDNLDDFNNVFENQSVENRKTVANDLAESFGQRFIIFPNPMYGSWENLLYQQWDFPEKMKKEETRYRFLSPFPLSN